MNAEELLGHSRCKLTCELHWWQYTKPRLFMSILHADIIIIFLVIVRSQPAQVAGQFSCDSQ